MADIDKQRFPPNVTTLPMTDLARLQALNPKTVAYLKAHFEYARLNGEDTARKLTFRGYDLSEAELAQALGLTGYPTTVFLEPDGTYITRVPGFVPTETFLQILRFIGSEAYRTQSFEEFAGKQR